MNQPITKMKNIITTLSVVLMVSLSGFTMLSSNESLMSNFTYFKTFSITHESFDLGHNHIERKIVFNKNMDYNLILENNDCDVVIQIHDDNGRLMMTNFDEKHDVCFNSIVFKCTTTRMYTISLDPERSKAHGVCKVGFRPSF